MNLYLLFTLLLLVSAGNKQSLKQKAKSLQKAIRQKQLQLLRVQLNYQKLKALYHSDVQQYVDGISDWLKDTNFIFFSVALFFIGIIIQSLLNIAVIQILYLLWVGWGYASRNGFSLWRKGYLLFSLSPLIVLSSVAIFGAGVVLFASVVGRR